MPPARRPTMRDVATHAEVSFKTVSRVVNGESGVSPELRERVRDAIEALEYRPDDRARLLRQNDTATANTIGFVMVDVGNPFFGSLLRGIEEVAASHKSLVLAASSEGSTDRERDLVQAFVGRRVDGLIMVSADAGNRKLQSEIERGTPVVFVDIAPGLPDSDLVRTDHLAAAKMATEHMLKMGHTKIAYFGDDLTVYSAALRAEGYREAMNEAGQQVTADHVLTGSFTEAEWQAVAKERLTGDDAPTAILSAQNFVTLGVVRALHELGLQRQVAQIGIDDVEMADVVEPGLTVVPQYPRQIGSRAAELLFARLAGDTQPPVHDVIAPHLVLRGSGEIPRR